MRGPPPSGPDHLLVDNNLFWPACSPPPPPLHELFGPSFSSSSSSPSSRPFLQLPRPPIHSFALLSRLFDRSNAKLGLFIGNHPLWHVLASLAFVFLLSIHLLNLNIEYDIRRSFSPDNSKAIREEAVYKEFFNLTTSPQRAFILFTAKDSGTMLRPEHIREALKLDSELSQAMSQMDETTKMHACDPLCHLNRPFHIVAHSLLSSNSTQQNGSSSSSSSVDADNDHQLQLDYPVSRYLGNPLFVGINFFGAQMVPRRDDQHAASANHSRRLFVRTVILWYFNRADTPESRRHLRESTLRLFEEAQSGQRMRHVNFRIFGDEIANSEMIRGAIQATILMSIGLLLLLLFVTFVVYRKMGSLVSVPAVLCIVLVSVLCPLLSSLAAFGLSTWLGNRTYTMMCVTPFLIAGVGVDDAFIMLQSWQQHSSIPCFRQRLSLVLVHIGPSITITSLTNTIAFGIGYFTPTPQMSLFCLCTSIAVFIDFLLTFSLLAPILVLLSAHSPSPRSIKSLSPSLAPSSSTPSQSVLLYSQFLHSRWGRLSAILLAVALYAVGISGVLRLKSTFEPSKAFPSDSPLAHSIGSIREVFDEFFPISIIVNRPPNISDPVQMAQFNGMVSELERLPESWGPSRTLLWLRSYQEFDRKNAQFWHSLGFGRAQQYRLSLDNLDFFMAQLGNPPTVKTEKGEDGQLRLKAFQFSIVARGMTEWWNRAAAEEKVRAVLEKYAHLNATMHDADAPILNMLLTVKTDLIGSIAVTIVCMALVCSLFIAQPAGVGAIAVSITSICFTLVGVISWCGADLDPVTMVDVLLATGFSVDYTAHVAHQYYIKKGTSRERIAQSLDEMCPPMLQAGISTVLCMLPLIFVPTYAIVAFAKTIFAVVSIGLLHGLFFLPALLCALPGRKEEGKRARGEKKKGKGGEEGGGGGEEEGKGGENSKLTAGECK